jgi:hypothetical protein
VIRPFSGHTFNGEISRRYRRMQRVRIAAFPAPVVQSKRERGRFTGLQILARNIVGRGPVDPIISVILLDADIAREIPPRHARARRLFGSDLLQVHAHVLRKLIDHRPAVDQERTHFVRAKLAVAQGPKKRMRRHTAFCRAGFQQNFL